MLLIRTLALCGFVAFVLSQSACQQADVTADSVRWDVLGNHCEVTFSINNHTERRVDVESRIEVYVPRTAGGPADDGAGQVPNLEGSRLVQHTLAPHENATVEESFELLPMVRSVTAVDVHSRVIRVHESLR